MESPRASSPGKFRDIPVLPPLDAAPATPAEHPAASRCRETDHRSPATFRRPPDKVQFAHSDYTARTARPHPGPPPNQTQTISNPPKTPSRILRAPDSDPNHHSLTPTRHSLPGLAPAPSKKFVHAPNAKIPSATARAV